MYAIDFSMGGHLSTDIYTQLADVYKLPSIATLLTSIDSNVSWLSCNKDVQIYYLENLRETSPRHIFQVRFKTGVQARDFTSVFLSVENISIPYVHTLSLVFVARGDRNCSSNILGWLKEEYGRNHNEPDFQLQGYAERNELTFIREHTLSAFQWYPELRRYLHVRDRFEEVKEVQRGILAT